jgi:cbb3-type cytochrome oxidase maturation protein
MIWMILSSLAAALGGLGLYIYYLRKGQFDDDEAVKYQIFRDENPDS